ncbi:uncharacterized protein [Diabrotica undecimpunctata]|uniref:uncharacterized protein n=1 Tax=Diabrotica undecimpunctata TaxID=50387 RepID=UPI003B641630
MSPADTANNITRKQIFFILIKKRFKNSLTSAKTFRGADVSSDHNPLVGHIELKLKKRIKSLCELASLAKNQAARQYGIPVATLNRRIKSGKNEEEASRKKLGRFQTVFSPEQEKTLVDHLIGMDKLFFDLSYLELRSLAFHYAEINKIPNNFHKQNCLAGKDWLYLFFKRHPQLTLRTPENTSAARASGFNKVSADTFFTLLAELQDKYAFSASRTYNCDESGITLSQISQPKLYP